MSYSIRQSDKGQWSISLSDEPEYCHALNGAVWSGPDRAAINIALAAVKEENGQCRLGIRVFDEFDEIRDLFPDDRERYGSPQWLLLLDGVSASHHAGILTTDQLREFPHQRIKTNG